MGGRTDRHTDAQHEALIPRHYGVAGYNKKKKMDSKMLPVAVVMSTLRFIIT